MIAKGKLQTSGSGKNNYASVGGLFDAYATKSDLKNIELYLFLEQLSLSLFVKVLQVDNYRHSEFKMTT